MPVVEEILVRLRADNDELRAKVAEAQKAIEAFKAQFPIDAQPEGLIEQIDAVGQSLDNLDEAGQRAGEGVADAETAISEIAVAGAEAERTVGALLQTLSDLETPADAARAAVNRFVKESFQDSAPIFKEWEESVARIRQAIDDFEQAPVGSEESVDAIEQLVGAWDSLGPSVEKAGLTARTGLDSYGDGLLIAREIQSSFPPAIEKTTTALRQLTNVLPQLTRGLSAAAIGLKVLTSQGKALGDIQSDLAKVTPELAARISKLGGVVKDVALGPFTNLRRIIRDGAAAYADLGVKIDDLSPKLQQQLADGEAVQQIFQTLFEDIAATVPALERQAGALQAVSNRLRSTGEETQAANAELGAQARALADQFEDLGISIPRNLQRVIDRTQDAVDVVKALAGAEMEAEKAALDAVAAAEKAGLARAQEAQRRLDAIAAFTDALGLNREALIARTEIAVAGSQEILDGEDLTTEGAKRLREEVEALVEQFRVLGEDAPDDLQAVVDALQPALAVSTDLQERIEKLNEIIRLGREEAAANRAASQQPGADPDAVKRVEDLTRAQRRLREETERLKKTNEEGGLDPEGLQELFAAQDQLRQINIDLAAAQRDVAESSGEMVVAFGPAISEAEAFEMLQRALAEQGSAAAASIRDAADGTEQFAGAAAGAKVELQQLADGTFRLVNAARDAAVEVEILEDGTLRVAAAASEAGDEIGTMGDKTDRVLNSFEQLAQDGPGALFTVGAAVTDLDLRISGVLTKCRLLRACLLDIQELGVE